MTAGSTPTAEKLLQAPKRSNFKKSKKEEKKVHKKMAFKYQRIDKLTQSIRKYL